MVNRSLLAAIGTALCYGVGSVLQAIGSRRAAEPDEGGEVAGLVSGLVGQVPFVSGLGLDGLGLCLSIYALRSLPLFVVQASIAASVAVTAVTATLLLHARLRRPDWYAIASVILGLALLAAASGVEQPVGTSLVFRLSLVVLALVIASSAALVIHLRPTGAAQLLGALAGLGYGVSAVSIRVTLRFTPSDLVTNPATLAALVAGTSGILTFATALRRGSVTGATGALTAAETLLPSLVGLAILGERPRAGWWPVALLGFVITVCGALALSRFGEAAEPEI